MEKEGKIIIIGAIIIGIGLVIVYLWAIPSMDPSKIAVWSNKFGSSGGNETIFIEEGRYEVWCRSDTTKTRYSTTMMIYNVEYRGMGGLRIEKDAAYNISASRSAPIYVVRDSAINAAIIILIHSIR